MTRAALSALESGAQGTSLATLCRIAYELGVEPADLLPSRGELENLLREGGGKAPTVAKDAIVEEYLKEAGYGNPESTESSEEDSS